MKPISDVEAAEMLLKDKRLVSVFPVPLCGGTPQQLRSAVNFAAAERRIAVLLCEDCFPEERYLVIRTVDLPILLAHLHDLLIETA